MSGTEVETVRRVFETFTAERVDELLGRFVEGWEYRTVPEALEAIERT